MPYRDHNTKLVNDREYYRLNREALNAKRRKRHAKNREDDNRRSSEYYRAHRNDLEFKQKMKVQRDNWRKNNRDKYLGGAREYNRKHGREYYAKNKEKCRERAKQFLATDEGKGWRKQYAKSYYLKNRETIRARRHDDYHQKYKSDSAYRDAHREWQKKHPEKLRQYARIVYRNNREHYLSKSKRWRASHQDKIQEYQQRESTRQKAASRRLKNREHLNAWSRDYYHKHRERKREYLREWSKRSPRRRLIFQKWERCGRLCYICGKDLPKVEIVVDHVVPSIKGGPNHISNLMPTHNRCNCKKNDKLNYSFARPDLLEIANG